MSDLPVNQVLFGNCLEVLKTLPDNSVDAVVSDPPYGLGTKQPTRADIIKYLQGGQLDTGGDFMGKDWEIPPVAVWEECFRVLKPGGHVLAFAGTRTFDMMSVGIRAAGFEDRDTVASMFGPSVLQWVYGCLSEDTEILTETGWEPYHRPIEGMRALCYDLEGDTYEWQPIQQVYVYPYNDTAYRLRGDRTDQLVSRNHRCLVERGGRTVFEYAEALGEVETVPVLEDVSGLLQALPLPVIGDRQALDLWKDVRWGADSTSADGTQATRGMSRQSARDVCGVHQTGLENAGVDPQSSQTNLFSTMQRHSSWGGMGTTRSQGPDGCDSGGSSFGHREDDRPSQPSMEGRSDLLLETRELRVGEVREMSARVSPDGSQGRVRGGASTHRGQSVGAVSHTLGDGTSLQSQPYGQPGGELGSLPYEPGTQAVRASRFTTTDLVRVEPVFYEGIVWCVRVPTGAFVARRNGKVFITGNSGFPKILDIAKAIDKMLKVKGKLVRTEQRFNEPSGIVNSDRGAGAREFVEREIREPASDEAKKWAGWGTALKPAWEPILCFRKPTGQATTRSVLENGVGGINIGGCRIGTEERVNPPAGNVAQDLGGNGHSLQMSVNGMPDDAEPTVTVGRWPANVLLNHTLDCKMLGTKRVKTNLATSGGDPNGHGIYAGRFPRGDGRTVGYAEADGREEVEDWECAENCPVAMLDCQSGVLKSGKVEPHHMRNSAALGGGGYSGGFKDVPLTTGYGDEGGASRFFTTVEPESSFYYTAKASRSDRNEGLDKGEKGTYMPGILTLRDDVTDEQFAEVTEAFSSQGAETYSDRENFPPQSDKHVPNHVRKYFRQAQKGERGNIHVTVKPVALMRWLVRLVCPKGGVVLDPYSGSGTTLVAAAEEGMDFIGIELDPAYHKIASKRATAVAAKRHAKEAESSIFEAMMSGDE